MKVFKSQVKTLQKDVKDSGIGRPIQRPPKDNPDFMDISDADFEAIETKIANAKV